MRTAAVLTIVFLSGCASGPRAASPASEQTVRVVGTSGGLTQIATTGTARPRIEALALPLEHVWKVLPEAYQTLGIPLTQRDAATGVLGNGGFRARLRLAGAPMSRFLDCGRTQGAPSADTYDIHLTVFTEVHMQSADSTIVTTTVSATGRPVSFAGESVQCASKGEIENRILNVVRAASAG